MATHQSLPLAPGSVSLRLYPHELPGRALVEELLAQADLADRVGFDGVMTAEHHGGFRGYLPLPVQVAGWCLEVMKRAWAAPCPILLPLRHWTQVAEELAWLACRFPERLGAGFGAGGWEGDFKLVGIPFEENMQRFKAALPQVVGALRGAAVPPLTEDAAIASLGSETVPLAIAAMSPVGVRRAASLSLGVLFDSLQNAERIRALTDAYHDAGGTGPCILIRRAWLGPPPAAAVEGQMQFYRGYTSSKSQTHWGEGQELISGPDGAAVAEGLAKVLEATACDALNLRVHVHGLEPALVREQIERIGNEALPLLPGRTRPP
jgi:alkanesulfonate monooxygenase SsuD/methylene tetrahydromethanopterin reductase-like flavin-dependent oxidoreductase (luciferase family)